MKQVSFAHINLEKKKSYSDYVNDTAKLIGKSYVATLMMVESWPPEELARLYEDCLAKWRNEGFKSPAHRWWTMRGKRIGKIWNVSKKRV